MAKNLLETPTLGHCTVNQFFCGPMLFQVTVKKFKIFLKKIVQYLWNYTEKKGTEIKTKLVELFVIVMLLNSSILQYRETEILNANADLRNSFFVRKMFLPYLSSIIYLVLIYYKKYTVCC